MSKCTCTPTFANPDKRVTLKLFFQQVCICNVGGDGIITCLTTKWIHKVSLPIRVIVRFVTEYLWYLDLLQNYVQKLYDRHY